MSKVSKRGMPIWAKVVCVVLVCVLALGVAMALFGDREVNPKNLIKADNYQIIDQNTLIGLEVDVKDDGAIFVSGKATQAYEKVITTLQLEPGTYTFGGCKSQIGKYGLKLTLGAAEVHYAGVKDENQGSTFTIEGTEPVTVTISLFVGDEQRVFQTFKPTLVKGEEAIDFYK